MPYWIYYYDTNGRRVSLEPYCTLKSVKQGIIKMINFVLYNLSERDKEGIAILEHLKTDVEKMNEADLINDGVKIPDNVDSDSFLIDYHSGTTYYISKSKWRN